jgi:hypothetical protein
MALCDVNGRHTAGTHPTKFEALCQNHVFPLTISVRKISLSTSYTHCITLCSVPVAVCRALQNCAVFLLQSVQHYNNVQCPCCSLSSTTTMCSVPVAVCKHYNNVQCSCCSLYSTTKLCSVPVAVCTALQRCAVFLLQSVQQYNNVQCSCCSLYSTTLASLQAVTGFRVLSCPFVNFSEFSITCRHCCLFSFEQITSCCFFKLKESKIIFGFRQTQLYLFILLYSDVTYHSTDHHPAISTKLKARCYAVQIVFL